MAIFLLIFLLLLIGYAFLIDYYRKAWNSIPPEPPVGEKEPSTLLTVIIPVRNEAHNIPELLFSLHQQRYPKHLFQVIIIDDHSTDDTWKLLQETVHEELSLTTLKLEEYLKPGEVIRAHKKKAIETAIDFAQGELIVTTDADCRFNQDWLRSLAACYERTGAQCITAPVLIAPQKNLLSIFQCLDFLTLQGITGAAVYKQFHAMGNGANLAYTQTAFRTVDGFAGIDSLPTGDDMLLIHKIARQFPGQVVYLKSKPAIVVTDAAENWKAFFHQRIRWASKADKYDDKRIFRVLLLVYLLNVCFLVLGISSFFGTTWLFFFLLLLLAKVLIEFPFVNAVAIFFNQQALMKYFVILQPIHIIYTIIAGWLGKFSTYNWKGRTIKK